MRKVIILGSSRSNGNTFKITEELKKTLGCDVIDLKEKTIGAYDYEYGNSDDDYKAVIDRLVAEYDLWIFATPVYWYSMSGIMKNFVDRFSDCLRIDKETGRKIRGKKMAGIACGYDEQVFETYFKPFQLTAKYLGMDYTDDLYCSVQTDVINPSTIEAINAFGKKLNSITV